MKGMSEPPKLRKGSMPTVGPPKPILAASRYGMGVPQAPTIEPSKFSRVGAFRRPETASASHSTIEPSNFSRVGAIRKNLPIQVKPENQYNTLKFL